jgi:hypothetical protein
VQRAESGWERALTLVAHAGGGIQPTPTGDEDQRRGSELRRHVEDEAVGRTHGRGLPGRSHDTGVEAGGGEDLQRRNGIQVVKTVEDENLCEGKGAVLSHGGILRPAPTGGKWQKCHVS